MEELFGPDPARNLLPHDGEVNYHGRVWSLQKSDAIMAQLLGEISWKNDEVVMFGKRIVTARKVAWYGKPGLVYSYSGSMKIPLPWSPLLLDLKERTEELSRARFNSCLLNLYHEGSEGMGWHSDDEKSLERDSEIASLSFGAERAFRLKHKNKADTVSITLEHGSLLVMKGTTQSHWLHCVPKTKKILEPRINLTFRRMVE